MTLETKRVMVTKEEVYNQLKVHSRTPMALSGIWGVSPQTIDEELNLKEGTAKGVLDTLVSEGKVKRTWDGYFGYDYSIPGLPSKSEIDTLRTYREKLSKIVNELINMSKETRIPMPEVWGDLARKLKYELH